jgi:hypothetical protein
MAVGASLPAEMPLGAALARASLAVVRTGGRSLRGLAITCVFALIFAGIAFGAWSLRPVPVYSSQELRQGSAFDVTFRIVNSHAWLALPNLKVDCVLDHVRTSRMPPTRLGATGLLLPPGATGIEPGQSATFTCPFRNLIGHAVNDDPGVVQRSEIYFRATYSLPGFADLRWAEDSPRFVLNTRTLPPRWTPKPEN